MRDRIFVPFAALACVLCLMGGCAQAPVSLKMSDYPVLPVSPPSSYWQARAERSPALKEKLYWENYGGPGNRGGRPADEMDWLFYAHDVAYLRKFRIRDLRKEDRILVRELKAIDPATLSVEGRAYRKRAITFFKNPLSRWIGKPREILLHTRRGSKVIWIEEKDGA